MNSRERVLAALADKQVPAAPINTLDRALRDVQVRHRDMVVSLKDEDRIFVEEAVIHYLPRPLYVLTTIINRLNGMNISAERKRALTALILVACAAGNTLWAHPAERPRPKQFSTPNYFREHNVWMMLERGLSLWTGTGSTVPYEAWPKKIPESGGICIYEGRLKDLADEVKREIPIAAVIGSVPRPNQAFWTLSALWAGWLWGQEAVEPYKNALRRRRYDWGWNATALHGTFNHLNKLLVDGVPMFGLIAEPEPAFMTSVLTAAQTAGFKLESVALQTEDDPAQVTWKSTQKTKAGNVDVETVRKAMREHLSARGEPAEYLHIHCVGLIACGGDSRRRLSRPICVSRAGGRTLTTAVPGGFRYLASKESDSGTSRVMVLPAMAAM